MSSLDSTLAYQLQQDTEGIRDTLTQYNLEMGQTMLMVKRNESYKLLDYDTFSSYLAAHGLSQWAVDRAMRVVEFFCEQHKVPPDDLLDIGMHRLDEVRKAIKLEPENINEWLARAREWSPSDLINAVRELRGRPPLKPKEKEDNPHVGTTSFFEFVRGLGCAEKSSECSGPLQLHHWPSTKGAGGKYVICLCHYHHAIAQDLGPAIWFDAQWEVLANNHFDPLGEWLEKISA